MPPVRENVLLAPYTTLHVGGKARYVVTVATLDELKAAVLFAKEQALPLCVLGGGSNVLVGDEGFLGVVILMRMTGMVFESVSETTERVVCAAGEVLDELVSKTVVRGLWGLENLSHIPGTVGAAPIQNVGAYGVEVGELIEYVTALHVPTLTEVTLKNSECQFGYRDSIFKTPIGKEYIVTAVSIMLSKLPQPIITYADVSRLLGGVEGPTLSVIRKTIIAIRSEKFPDWSVIGTAGSFFKNPIIPRVEAEALRLRYPALPLYEVDKDWVKCSLGYVLDTVCGLKGYYEGGVGLYEKQALVVVVKRGATAHEVRAFADRVSKKVFAKTGIKIEQEVTVLEETTHTV